MPFTTGTADTAVDLQVKLAAHLTANGWSKLYGEEDQACASPKAARYWRVTVDEPDNLADFMEVELLHLRETVGGPNIATNGANWTIFNNASGTGADLVSGTTPVRSIDVDNAAMLIMQYDFGAPQIVREVSIRSDTGAEAPRRFHVEWSNDRITWTRMWSTEDAGESTGWANDSTRNFAFGDGYLASRHFSATRCRRTGYASTAKGYRDQGMFAFQGPGYDAARRVYFNVTTNIDLTGSTERWLLGAGTGFDVNNLSPWNDPAVGADTGATPRFIMPLGPFTYWIYSNSTRVIVIVRNGLDDYICMYIGFLKAFAKPDNYPFPLYVGGAASYDANIGEADYSLSYFGDPGRFGDGRMRRWDGVWRTVANRWSGAAGDLYLDTSEVYTWPYFAGGNGDGNFPFNISGDNDTFNTHWMNQVVPTAQNESFMWPVLVWDRTFGAVGAFDGVFVLPRAGLYSAEQVLTIGGQDYRVFKNRTRTNGNAYFAIRED